MKFYNISKKWPQVVSNASEDILTKSKSPMEKSYQIHYIIVVYQTTTEYNQKYMSQGPVNQGLHSANEFVNSKLKT